VKHHWIMRALALAGLACISWAQLASGGPAQASDDTALFAAICPIVYPVDQSASDRGVHYLFYGNGFFINGDGYLLTAAHVLSQLHGGQPYVLLRLSITAAPRIVPASLVAIDREHDVALLRVTPNPFAGNYRVSFLALSPDSPPHNQTVLCAALLPSKPRDAYTLNASIEMRARGEVLNSEFSQLQKGRGDTELFLFNHEVLLGQSGAPVISPESQEVVGLVEGQWLGRDTIAISTAEQHSLGAVLPVHYAIALLQQKRVAWHTASGDWDNRENVAEPTHGFSGPAPLSLVPAAYPSQSLFGGEVVLDALVDSSGRLADIKIVHGDPPFLEKALVAVRTWTFLPARVDGRVIETRIGIAFQFRQPYVPPRTATVHNYEHASAGALEAGATPTVTVEPEYPPSSTNAPGSVILLADISDQGQLRSAKVLRGSEPFTPAAIAAIDQWRFAPGKRLGASVNSPAIVVFTFSQPLVTDRAHSSRSSQ
jgi:TonB family protein